MSIDPATANSPTVHPGLPKTFGPIPVSGGVLFVTRIDVGVWSSIAPAAAVEAAGLNMARGVRI